jgi:hypothetical protein
MIRLVGREAIGVAEAFGLPLAKYSDPVEDARMDLTVAEARRVAREDPRLVYLDIDYTVLARQVEAAPTEEMAAARDEALADMLAEVPAYVLVDELASTLHGWLASMVRW